LAQTHDHWNDIRIVAITDKTNIAEIAAQENLADVDPRVPKSLRRLHGRIMENLAVANCRAVAWDIVFGGKSTSDEAFAQGANTLEQAGTVVVAAADRWLFDNADKIEINPLIATTTSVGLGCAQVGFSDKAPWYLPLCARRGLDHPVPSLALAAFAAFRQPGATAEYRLNVADRIVEVQYRPLDSRSPSLKTDRVLLTDLLPHDDGSGAHDPRYNLKPDDAVGTYLVDLPEPGAFERITVEYGDVCTAGVDQLRRWFGSRLVVVANLRSDAPDRFRHAVWGELPGCYGHVAGVSRMLSQASVRATSHMAGLTLLVVAGLTGVAIGTRIAGRHALRWLALGALMLILAAVSVVAYTLRGYLMNPFPAMVSLACAAEFAAALARLVHSRSD
jgi:CHASE2 domain-containing sensor protein